MMTSVQFVETSVSVTSNGPSQDNTHPDDHNFADASKCAKPFAFLLLLWLIACSALANKLIERVYPTGEKYVESSHVTNGTRILSGGRKREDPGNKILTKVLRSEMAELLNLTENFTHVTGANGPDTRHTVHIQDFTVASSQSGNLSTNFVTGMTAAYVVIFLVALFGNAFGLFVVLKKSSSKSATNLFIANMAVADLLLTFTVMPFTIAYFYRNTRWFGGVLGTVTCKALFYAIPISIAATVFTMVFVSFDRFYAIFYPFREKLFRKPKVLSAIIWVLSLVRMTPYVFLYQVKYDPIADEYFCTLVWPWEDLNDPTYEETYRVLKTFHIVVFITLYVLPLCVTGTNYSLICRKLWLRQIPGNVSDSNLAMAEKSKCRVVRLLVTVCVVFTLCWFPIYVNHYFWYVRHDQRHLLPSEVQLIFLWLSHANSAINPCLFVLLNSEFRRKMFATPVCHSKVAPRPLPPQPVPLVVRGRRLQLEQHNRLHVEGPVIE